MRDLVGLADSSHPTIRLLNVWVENRMPSPFRTLKPLAERIELDYFRRPRQLRPTRTVVTGVVLLASLAGLVAAVVTHQHRIFQAGPLATTHAMFENSCEQCHSQAFQVAWRLVPGNEDFRSVAEAACKRCHDGPIHNEQQIEGDTPHCASCHREHRGQKVLAQVDDAYCTGCHRNPKRHDGQRSELLPVRGFAADDHPEFRVLRDNKPDEAELKFNHAAHLKPGGVRDVSGKFVELQCSVCHQPDAERRYMRPINYERHCAECHSNELSVQLDDDWKGTPVEDAAEGFARQPVPHETPETIRAALRERLTQFVQSHPQILSGSTAAERSRPIAGRPRVQAVNEHEWSWVSVQLVAAERKLYDRSTGCNRCHNVNGEVNPTGLPRIAATRVPVRWLGRSQFRHDSHRMLDCTECHYTDRDKVRRTTKESTLTSDVLLPSIQTCQSCHSAASNARTDCFECHGYHKHDEERDFDGPFRVRELVLQLQ